MGEQSAISIFLSHSSKDKPLVRKIGNDLIRYGAKVWIDEGEIKIGDSLIDKISQGIQVADYLGVAISNASVTSEWVKRELNIALTREINGKSLKVLPLLLDTCEMPLFLIDKKYADFREESNYVDAIRAVANDLGLSGRSEECMFLRHYVFHDLMNRNNGFDVELIEHFSYEDFCTIMKRVEFYNIDVFGVEVFSVDGVFVDIEVGPSGNTEWIKKFISKWKDIENVLFSASYGVPQRLLELFVR